MQLYLRCQWTKNKLQDINIIIGFLQSEIHKPIPKKQRIVLTCLCQLGVVPNVLQMSALLKIDNGTYNAYIDGKGLPIKAVRTTGEA